MDVKIIFVGLACASLFALFGPAGVVLVGILLYWAASKKD